jgi:hypothetical protein
MISYVKATGSYKLNQNEVPGIVRSMRNHVTVANSGQGEGRSGLWLTSPASAGLILRPDPDGQVAQLVEQRIENPRVGGSIPPLATIISKTYVARKSKSKSRV